MEIDEQLWLLGIEKHKCEQRIQQSQNSSGSSNDTTHGCEMVWDNILCWDAAPAGTLQQQHCPNYINGFDTQKFATKYCTPEGVWFSLSNNSKHWTNYTSCDHRSSWQGEIFQGHGERLKLIQTIGYGVSLCSLVIAVLLMCCSRLKSKSNTLHVNLFLAFILRAILCFLQQILFVDGLGLKKDVKRGADGKVAFKHEGSHWECRVLYTTFLYSICASQMWIFMEGLYLHMLIYRTLTIEKNGVKPYIILGWALPVVVLIPFIFVKGLADNTLCWNLSSNPMYLWIIQGPMLATVLLNFIFFLNISRVLCSRVRSSQRHMGRSKYRKLAKFILVLIPLFGVFYIVLAIAFPLSHTSRFDLALMYVEQTYNAFQGFLLALLFCFLNEEVHSEIKSIWWRRRIRRPDSVGTRSFVLSSYKRNSYHPRGSVNPGHFARAPARQQSFENSEVKQETWFTRFKTNFLRQLGRDVDRDQSFRRASGPPIDMRECSTVERYHIDDLDMIVRVQHKDNTDGGKAESNSRGRINEENGVRLKSNSLSTKSSFD